MMAKKTYHHLKEGDFVVAEYTHWTGAGDLIVEKQFTEARVLHVGGKTLGLTTSHIAGTAVTISRASGHEWGMSDYGWRISPTFAQVKVKS